MAAFRRAPKSPRVVSEELKTLRIAVLLLAALVSFGNAWSLTTPRRSPQASSSTQTPSSTQQKKKKKSAATKSSNHKATSSQSSHHAKSSRSRHTAHAARLRQAFVASSELRPMAQQLATFRSPEAYAGVERYAAAHTGEAATAAYLALGHAYIQDHRYDDAVHALKQASAQSSVLDDYVQYLQATALEQGNQYIQALAVLNGYPDRYPESIFNTTLPVMVARLQIEAAQPQAALATLRAAPSLAGRADAQFLKARATLLAGDPANAAQMFRHIYKTLPLSPEALQSQVQLTQLAQTGVVLTAEDQHAHADALYAAHRYNEAENEFLALEHHPDINEQTRNDLRLDAAACAFKLKKLTRSMLENLPDTPDSHGAERLYLLMEDARTRNDTAAQHSYVDQLQARFPQSPWFQEALFSSGNMYFLANDYNTAIHYFALLLQYFQESTYAPYSHWKIAWLNYRLGNFGAAGPLFDEQIRRYPGGEEIPDALYWRGRELEEQEKAPALAKAYYTTLANAFHNYYFGGLARERLTTLSSYPLESVPLLGGIHAPHPKPLSDEVPEDDIHVIKARLLGNAGLNEYIAPEIRASPDSAPWANYAELQIYSQAGETFRALQVAKRITPSYYAVPVDSIPASYWRVLFPLPYWSDVQANAASNGLDPYLVLSLMRQESEFNPSVVSYANAYGLMQLLPSTGKSMARKAGLGRFSTNELLNPPVNVQLGTLYLRQTLDKFHGQVEYALAAYNAGDDRVQSWLATGNFHDVPEFVECIPFTQTREYVQAILRNEAMYKRLNHVSSGE
jgi:soluble lytic murein transglycosylase